MSALEKVAFCTAGAALVALVLWHSARADAALAERGSVTVEASQ